MLSRRVSTFRTGICQESGGALEGQLPLPVPQVLFNISVDGYDQKKNRRENCIQAHLVEINNYCDPQSGM